LKKVSSLISNINHWNHFFHYPNLILKMKPMGTSVSKNPESTAGKKCVLVTDFS